MPTFNRYRIEDLSGLQNERWRSEDSRNICLADWIPGNISHNSNPTIVDQFNDELGGLANEFTQWNMGDFFAQFTPIKKVKIGDVTRKYLNPHYYIPDEFNFNSITNDESLYLGIELEVDNGGKSEENAKFIQEFLGEKNCYIVSDGSLNNGLEIVTHPCTLQYHKKLSYKDLFEELKEKGYKSHDTSTCGYHIHINRDFFSSDLTIQDLCITKILYLIEKYWKYVTVIARRRSNQYSKRFGIKDNESMFELLIKAKGSYVSKYNVVNLQHSKTIEFRMFRGTLKYETFIATMEFVHNLAYICKDTSLEDIQNIEFQDILNVYQTEYLLLYFNNRIENMNNTVDLEDEYKENLRRRIFIRDEWAFLHESSVEQM